MSDFDDWDKIIEVGKKCKEKEEELLKTLELSDFEKEFRDALAEYENKFERPYHFHRMKMVMNEKYLADIKHCIETNTPQKDLVYKTKPGWLS